MEPRFISAVADCLPEHIAVIDASGHIEWVNRSWIEFGRRNGAPEDVAWVGRNYLGACDPTPTGPDPASVEVQAGILDVVNGVRQEFSTEYPCRDEDREGWFLMRVVPLRGQGPKRFVISHHDITDRKLAEDRARREATRDGLTGVANRRALDRFLQEEWSRASRHAHPMSLILFDIDDFKRFNDLYGHVGGDECLRRVAARLERHARRPSDLFARFGGEEFALVLGATPGDAALEIARAGVRAIRRLEIPHAGGRSKRLTVSAGVGCAVPEVGEGPHDLVRLADEALYEAKLAGRDRAIGAAVSTGSVLSA